MGNCISPNALGSVRTRELERDEILAAYKRHRLEHGQTCFVLSSKWFLSWKQYSGFKLAEEEQPARCGQPTAADAPAAEEPESGGSVEDAEERQPPGPINNADLEGAHEGQLRKDLIEEYDFDLVPAPVYHLLEDWYGGGPRFPRTVLELNDPHGEESSFSVELHPYLCEAIVCDADGQPDSRAEAAKHFLNFSRITPLNQVELVTCEKLGLSPHACRLWYSFVLNDEDATGDQSDEIEWHLLKQSARHGTMPLGDRLDDSEDVLVKVAVECKHQGVWPRDRKGDDWRTRLSVGDLCDAMDMDKRWFEARVVEDQGDKLLMHFMGWSSRWDTWIERTSTALQPLHSKTELWRDLKMDDPVEVCQRAFTDTESNSWYAGVVVKVTPIDKAQALANPGQSVSGNRKQVLVRAKVGEALLDNDSELLCKIYTHTKPTADDVRGAARGGANGRSAGGGWARSSAQAAPMAPGVVGLANIGNTCFMNSMIQCISQAPCLTTYFLEGNHKRDLNKSNPLGTGGKLALAYANLLAKQWAGNYATIVPKDFKQTLGHFAPQFAGYQQQDSQEFMSFLMDGIHEDLNRIRKKPYTEAVEGGDGKPDSAVASETWRRHLLRNDSVVVDRCQGLLRSHLTCPVCEHESVTFDPFMSLSLPVPSPDGDGRHCVKLQVTVVPLPAGSTPVVLTVEVPMNGVVSDLKAKVALLLPGLEPVRMHVVDIWSNRVHHTLKSNEPLADIRKSDVTYVYELEQPTTTRTSTARACDVIFVRPSPSRGRSTAHTPSSRGDRRLQHTLTGTPWRFSFGDQTTCAEVHEMLVAHCSRLVQGGDARGLFAVHQAAMQGRELGGALPEDNTPLRRAISQRMLTVAWLPAATSLFTEDALDTPVPRKPAAREDDGRGCNVELEDCFRAFVAREQLGQDDLWYCPKCHDHVPAFKKLDLWALPDVLIIHLKRFQYTPGSYFVHRQKIDAFVHFPLDDLNLSQLVLGPTDQATPHFTLFGVSEHMGGLAGGHYTALAKNMDNDKWYSFNDALVQEEDPEAAISRNAYVLFYRRSDGQARWAGMQPSPPPSNGKKNSRGR